MDLGAILEPLSVAIHAARRAQVAPKSTTLVFGAGAVGLLCAAMAKASGSAHVIIADIDKGRVDFATQNSFAHAGFVVPMKRGQTVEEKLEIAKDTAALTAQLQDTQGQPVGEVDVVFECTGVESCLQAGIYVPLSSLLDFGQQLTMAGYSTRWKNYAHWHGHADPDSSYICSGVARGRLDGRIPIRKHVSRRNRSRFKQERGPA